MVFLHPFGCSLDERLDRFYLSNAVGQPVEDAVALSHLVFAGVLDRHPGLRIVAAHGGGYLPTFLGRSDHAWQCGRTRSGCAERRELPAAALVRLARARPRVALRRSSPPSAPTASSSAHDYPFDMGVPTRLHRLDAAGLAAADRDAIAGGTAEKLGLVPGKDPIGPRLIAHLRHVDLVASVRLLREPSQSAGCPTSTARPRRW